MDLLSVLFYVNKAVDLLLFLFLYEDVDQYYTTWSMTNGFLVFKLEVFAFYMT